MWKSYLIISIGLLLGACKNDIAAPPANLLSPEQMQTIILDISLANSVPIDALDSLVQKDLARGTKHFQAVLQKNKTTWEHFQKSHEYYASQPKIYNEILDNVLKKLDKDIATLKKNKEKLDKEKPKPVKKQKVIRNDRQIRDSILKREKLL